MWLIVVWTCDNQMKRWTLCSSTKYILIIVHLESDICDRVDIRGSDVGFEINGCRFVNVLLVNIDWTFHCKTPDGCALDYAFNEYVTLSIDKILWIIDYMISNARCATFILVGVSIITCDHEMNFMGWVMRNGILEEWVEVLLISSKLLSGLKISASKILSSVKIGWVSILIPSMFIFNFREEMESSRWYACGWWRLLRSWRIF